MVATVDEGRAPLELADKVVEEVRLAGVVELFDAALGDDATAVCLGLGLSLDLVDVVCRCCMYAQP